MRILPGNLQLAMSPAPTSTARSATLNPACSDRTVSASAGDADDGPPAQRQSKSTAATAVQTGNFMRKALGEYPMVARMR